MNSQEFPFDEANWEKAAAMIDASRKGKNRAGFWIFSTLIVLTCGVIGFYTIGNVASSDTETLAQNAEAARKNAETMASSIVVPDASASQPEVSGANTGSAPVTTENSTSSNNHLTSDNTTLPTEHQTEKVSAYPASNKVNSGNAEINVSKKANTKIPTSSKPSSAASTNENPITANSQSAKPVDTTPAPTSKSTMGQDVNANDQVAKTSSPSETKTESKAAEVKGAKTPQTLPVLGQNTPASGETGNTAKLGNTDNTVAAVDTVSKEIAKATKIDTASTVAEISKPEAPKLHKHLISLEAGTSYMLGWQNPTSTDANGFNPIIGINYTGFFNKHVGLSLGLQYNSIGNLSYSSHTSMDTHYSFGQENDVTVITPTKLHYLVAPVKLNFAINPKNIIGAGCNIAYLMTVDNKVDTYNERLNYTSEHSVSKTKGYVSGINQFDYQLSLFYRRTLYKDLSINAEVMYGLKDVKDNTFFNSNVYERNVGFKLTLLLNVFKK